MRKLRTAALRSTLGTKAPLVSTYGFSSLMTLFNAEAWKHSLAYVGSMDVAPLPYGEKR